MIELEAGAACWLKWLTTFNEETLPEDLQYYSSTGQRLSLPYEATLLHVFHHATHHRGQISAALTQLGYACPEIDMIYMLLEEQQAT